MKNAVKIHAIPRIIEACEGSTAHAAAELINHLLGAKCSEFAGSYGSDLILSPVLLARLLRAAGGEQTLIGDLLFPARDGAAASEIATHARKLQSLFEQGTRILGQEAP